MADLIASTALEGRAPIETAEVWLGETAIAPITVIAPFRWQEAAVDALLAEALGLGFPRPGQVIETAAARIAWAGHAQAFLLGAEAPDMRGHAALTDVSDGWVALRLHGARAGEVLARLVPVDLGGRGFGPGSAARTRLGQIMTLILRRDAGFEILVMRSFASSAWHEIEAAMKSLAARG